jgi:hypothetical protein
MTLGEIPSDAISAADVIIDRHSPAQVACNHRNAATAKISVRLAGRKQVGLVKRD